MVVYKDSQSLVALDPVEWTGTWYILQKLTSDLIQKKD